MIVSSSGGDFKPIPEGNYIATCVRVIDLGTQITSFKGADSLKRKVLIAWEVPDVMVEWEGQEQPALVMSSYTASLHEKANLRQHLEAWRGRRFTDDELRGFDLKNVLGKGCQIQVLHSEDGAYANVKAIMALPKGMPNPGAVHELINFDLDDLDDAILAKLSDKLRAKIEQSPEYKHATGQAPINVGGDGRPEEYFPSDLDDEIPFATNWSLR